MLAATKYTKKKKVCNFFNKGNCKFGSACRNLHVNTISIWNLELTQLENELPINTNNSNNTTTFRILKEEFDYVYLRLVYKEEDGYLLFEPDPRKFWLNGEKMRCPTNQRFAISSSEFEVGSIQEHDHEKVNLIKEQLYHAFNYGKSNLNANDISETINNSWKILYKEKNLDVWLKQNSNYFKDSRVELRTLEENISLGATCCAHLLGPMELLLDICKKFNNTFMRESDCIFGDKIHAMIAMPLSVLKGKDKDLRDFLRHHLTSQLIIIGDKKIEFHTSHLIWASMGYRRDEHYEEENINPPIFGNYRNLLSRHFLKEDDMPFWVQSTSTRDDEIGILVTIAVYKDSIVFSMPGGKRQLGETSWEAMIRELKEETYGVIDVSSSMDYEGYNWIPEFHIKADPTGGIDNYIFLLQQVQSSKEPNKDTSTMKEDILHKELGKLYI